MAVAFAGLVGWLVAWSPHRAVAGATFLVVAAWLLACALFSWLDVWMRVVGPSIAVEFALVNAIVASDWEPRVLKA